MPIQTITDSVRRWGLLRTSLALFYRRVVRPMGVHLYEIQMRELNAPRETNLNNTGLTFRQVSLAEMRSAAEDAELHIDSAFVTGAFQRGDMCIGAYDNEKLVAYAWRSFAVAPHRDGVTIYVRRPYGYTYKVFTRAEYRGRGAWPMLNSVADQACLERLCNRLIGFIEIENFASLRAAEKLGAHRIGYAGFVRCLGKSFAFHSRGVRETEFRFVA